MRFVVAALLLAALGLLPPLLAEMPWLMVGLLLILLSPALLRRFVRLSSARGSAEGRVSSSRRRAAMPANPSNSPINAPRRVSRVSGRVASSGAPQGPFRRNAGGVS